MTLMAVLHLFVTWFGLNAVVAVACLLAWYFIPELPWFTTKLRQLCLQVGVVLIAWNFAFAWGYGSGVQYQANAAAKNDASAVSRANDAKSKVDLCDIKNGEWDATTGTCDR